VFAHRQCAGRHAECAGPAAKIAANGQLDGALVGFAADGKLSATAFERQFMRLQMSCGTENDKRAASANDTLKTTTFVLQFQQHLGGKCRYKENTAFSRQRKRAYAGREV